MVRLPAALSGLVVACICTGQSVQDTTTTTTWKDNWLNFPGIGIRSTFAIEVTEVGLYGNWMFSHQRELGSGLTALGPELSLSAVFTGNTTYRRGTVGIRAMHLFGGMVGPCGGASFDNISYRTSLDDTRFTAHGGLTFLDFVTIEYARSTPLTGTTFVRAEDLLLLRVGFNGAVLLALFENVPMM